ncbi:MAG: iron-sulfur cluster assembly accessory protein [Elusimicrobia bacterium]|nr:iron-sulfur cluster assembly accessory protein [Elusimicrobiota bacterium]
MLTLTPKAVEKIQNFMKSEDSLQGKSLRLKVEPSGCAGYEYKIAFDDKADGDKILPQNGFDVLVDAKTLPLIEQATIDYAEDEASSGFRINNPLEKGSCGCGKSKQF